MTVDSNARIYKTFEKPILTYGTENRGETERNNQTLRTTEMKTLRILTGNSLKDRML